MTPKSLGVLQALLERAGEIVTKDEIFRAVWRETVVSDATLTSCIQELRRALRDDARSPRYIETHHRLGFRFLVQPAPGEDHRRPEAGPFVGRDSALQQLDDALLRARAGIRQIVCITGEAGIGKTTLVDVFLARILDEDRALVARADCVEHYGAGEAYHPLLEALPRLCRHARAASSIAALRRHAPSWLAQLPGLQTRSELAALERRAAGVTPGRMLRELSDALEAMSTRDPLVLCIDDLHWSDPSTRDWILSFTHRQDGARILLVMTLRRGEGHESARAAQELVTGLRVRGLASEVSLARLDDAAVTDYVQRRFSPDEETSAPMLEMARLVHRRSEGNPLFIVNILNDLIARNALALRSERWVIHDALQDITTVIPADVRGSIDEQTRRLAAGDRKLLEVASILPASFPAAAVAAGAGTAIREAEASLRTLARRGTFLREAGEREWPDGTVSTAFEFVHSLYREVLGEHLRGEERATTHGLIGHRLEEAYGSRGPEIAAELAVHFEHACDYPRTIAYLRCAAEADQRRNAHDGAQRRLRHALSLLDRLPHSIDRDKLEVGMRMRFGGVLMQLSGWGAPEVEESFLRARELSIAHGLHEEIFAATWNLWVCAVTHGRIAKASELTDSLFVLAEESPDPEKVLQAHHARWTTCFALGDFQGVELHTSKGIALVDRHHEGARAFGSHDPRVCALTFRARIAALCGQGLAAVESIREAVESARKLDHPFTLALALTHSSAVHLEIADAAVAREHADQAIAIAREFGFGLMLAWASCFRGSALVECGQVDEGLALMREAVAEARALHTGVFEPHLLSLIAKAQLMSGRLAEAERSIEEALEVVDGSGECTYMSELQRLRAELRLANRKDDESMQLAESELRESLETAQRQGAYMFAHRAEASIALLHG